MEKTYWVARNMFGNLHVFNDEPFRIGTIFCRKNIYSKFEYIPSEYTFLFADVTWHNSPKKIVVDI